MSNKIDVYKTITATSKEILFKEKKSKFYGYAYHVQSEKEIKNRLEELKTKHANAGHFCYAYQIGTVIKYYRVNDDGEPNNSAGQPIYGQIQHFNLTNVLVIIVRYFGGVKLGVGGLISAYRNAAKLSLEASKIKEKYITDRFQIEFSHNNTNKVMLIINKNRVKIESQIFQNTCIWEISVRKSNSKSVLKQFSSHKEINLIEL